MNYLINNMSVSLYSVIMIACGAGLIYGIIDMKKKQPGHPFVNALYGLLAFGFYTVIHKFIKEYSTNLTLINISRYLMWTVFVAFLIAFIYFAYLAYQKGFVDEKGRQLLKNTIIPCAVVIFIGVIVFIIAYILYLHSEN